jgi:glucosamine--fructose-6-phosphate aminotransferase (isomerizing)
MDLPDNVSKVLDISAEKISRFAPAFSGRRAVDCIGANASLGSAGEASLQIREAVRLPAWAVDTRHYLHGPMEAMDAATGAVVFGDDREIKLAEDLAGLGCAVLLVTTREEPKDRDNLAVIRIPALENRVARGILEILPVQLLTADLSTLCGLDVVKFRYPQSDTKIRP